MTGPREKGFNMRWVPPWWTEGLQDQHQGALAAVKQADQLERSGQPDTQ